MTKDLQDVERPRRYVWPVGSFWQSFEYSEVAPCPSNEHNLNVALTSMEIK